jgi:uncharacterized repeat protein (TIGR03803 family)
MKPALGAAFAALMLFSALDATAVTETVIQNFNANPAADGAYPGAALIFGPDGALYSTASGGGCGGGLHCGTLFQLAPPGQGQSNWTFAPVYYFCNDTPPPQGQPCLLGNWPQASVITDSAVDNSGSFYTTTWIGGTDFFGIVTKITPPSQGQTNWTGTAIYNFTGGADGGYPLSALIADQSGALYGTTTVGGLYNNGAVFKLAPPSAGQTNWTETTIWSFSGGTYDGSYPIAGLIADQTGALYGTTYDGGFSGSGTVFQLTPPGQGQSDWTETILWDFLGTTLEGTDGAFPAGKLIMDASGNLYGTTTSGGFLLNDGTVFKLSPPGQGQTSWTETLLWSFSGSNGALPYGGLIMDKKGKLYGTTYSGGRANDKVFGGTVFRLNPPALGKTNWTETILHKFLGGSDGAAPYDSVVPDASGNLYGTTAYGGGTACASSYALGCGTVFQITSTGFKP